MYWVCNHIVIWNLSAKSGQCVTSLFVVLPIRIFSFSTNVYNFWNLSYRILRFFFTQVYWGMHEIMDQHRYIFRYPYAFVWSVYVIFLKIFFLEKTNCLRSVFRRLRKKFQLCTLIVSSMSAYSVSEEFAIVTILSSGMSPPSP